MSTHCQENRSPRSLSACRSASPLSTGKGRLWAAPARVGVGVSLTLTGLRPGDDSGPVAAFSEHSITLRTSYSDLDTVVLEHVSATNEDVTAPLKLCLWLESSMHAAIHASVDDCAPKVVLQIVYGASSSVGTAVKAALSVLMAQFHCPVQLTVTAVATPKAKPELLFEREVSSDCRRSGLFECLTSETSSSIARLIVLNVPSAQFQLVLLHCVWGNAAPGASATGSTQIAAELEVLVQELCGKLTQPTCRASPFLKAVRAAVRPVQQRRTNDVTVTAGAGIPLPRTPAPVARAASGGGCYTNTTTPAACKGGRVQLFETPSSLRPRLTLSEILGQPAAPSSSDSSYSYSVAVNRAHLPTPVCVTAPKEPHANYRASPRNFPLAPTATPVHVSVLYECDGQSRRQLLHVYAVVAALPARCLRSGNSSGVGSVQELVKSGPPALSVDIRSATEQTPFPCPRWWSDCATSTCTSSVYSPCGSPRSCAGSTTRDIRCTSPAELIDSGGENTAPVHGVDASEKDFGCRSAPRSSDSRRLVVPVALRHARPPMPTRTLALAPAPALTSTHAHLHVPAPTPAPTPASEFACAPLGPGCWTPASRAMPHDPAHAADDDAPSCMLRQGGESAVVPVPTHPGCENCEGLRHQVVALEQRLRRCDITIAALVSAAHPQALARSLSCQSQVSEAARVLLREVDEAMAAAGNSGS